MKNFYKYPKIAPLWVVLAVGLIANSTLAQYGGNNDERRVFVDVGIGLGLLKAGNAYTPSPLFLKNTGAVWQIQVAPRYFINENLNVGLKLGGLARPKFEDLETNSTVQPKFTPYILATSEYYFGNNQQARYRYYAGLSAGITEIGTLEARDNLSQERFFFQRRDRSSFVTVAPKVGVSFGEIKIEIEYIVTMPFNPDFVGITLISSITAGRSKYY